MGDRELSEMMEELLAWTRFANHRALTDALRRTLADQKEFAVYELTDGTRTQAQVAKAAGVSQPTVSRLHAKWRRQGLLRQAGGAETHLTSPRDLGLDPPPT